MDQDHFVTDMLRYFFKASMDEVVICEDINAIRTTMIMISLLLSKYRASVIVKVKWAIWVTKTTVTGDILARKMVNTSVRKTVTMLVALVMPIFETNGIPLIRLPLGALYNKDRNGGKSGIRSCIQMSKKPVASRGLAGWGVRVGSTIVGERLR